MDPTAVAIIGWFVQVLFDQGITFVLDHWRRSDAAGDPDLPGAVDSLRHAVKVVQALLSRTRTIRSENEGLLELMKDLKDAAYEADDIFSEIDYYRLQQQVLEDDNSSKNAKKSSRGNFMLRVRNLCSCLNATNDNNQASTSSSACSSKDDNKASLVPRINSVVGRLEKITTAIREILPLLRPEEWQQNPPVPGHRITTSFLPPKETVIGRVNEKDQIITSLLLPAASVSMLPIVGIGGVGKTTLAQIVYNDEQIKKHFNKRIWVCVSDDFDVARLTREILQGLDVEGWDRLTNLNRLQELLVQKLQSVRYLLVLDDVWNEFEREKWRSLCAPLGSQKRGSRILMTTRLNPVVSIAATKIDMLSPCTLEGLPEDQYLSLFNTYAFGDLNPSHHPSLVDIGKQIAGRLTGSPLAAKTVGGLLREKQEVDYWKSVLNSPIWKLKQSDDDIMPALQLSYQHLRPQLQQCFIYCSVFPKDRRFGKNEMVGMWISQGYVNAKSSGDRTLEEIGSEYFDDLLSRSFIQAIDEDNDEYVLHDLLHDLAEAVSENEYLKINSKQRKEITSSVRHLHVHSNDLGLLKSPNLGNLRTLIIDGDESDDYSVLKEVLDGLKSIRVLILNYVTEQLLYGSIGHLTHLRYLAVYCKKSGESLVSGEGASALPAATNSIVGLRPYHLQRLISGKGGLALPAAAKYLVSLRHFGSVEKYPSRDYEAIWDEIASLSGIGKLTYLQELERFSVGKTEGRKLAELKSLNELKGTLRLDCLDNVSTKEEASEANLNKKEGIRALVFACGNGHATPHMAEEVFEGLDPPPYIKKLTLDTYLGVKSPTWMMTLNRYLSVLQSLTLSNCRNWKVLPPLGQLPLLRHLWISNADAVEEIGSSFYGSGVAKSFPCLEKLDFRNMPEWVVWSGVEEDTDSLFPQLRELYVWSCPKLKGVPMQCLASVEVLQTDCMVLLGELEKLTSLKELDVSDRKEMQSLPLLPASLVSLNIHDCHELSSVFTTQTDTQTELPSLLKITIVRCDKLVSVELKSLPSLRGISISSCQQLVSVELKCLPSLQKINIDECNQLVSVELKCLPSLQKVNIDECNQLVSVELKSLPSLEGLKISYCGTIRSVTPLEATLTELLRNTVSVVVVARKEDRSVIGEQEEDRSVLTSLKDITIRDCPRLRSLPPMPASLQRLWIDECPRLHSLPPMPASLRVFSIRDCPKLPRERYQEGGDNWHKISHVPTVTWE